MKQLFSKVLNHRFAVALKKFAAGHKIITGIIIILILFGGYKLYSSLTSTSGETQYVIATAAKNTIVVAITGSGQVSAPDQTDVKSKVSGDVVYVGAKNGDTVKTGQLIVQLDTTEAQKNVRDAQVSLDQAKLTLEKMKGLSTSEGDIRGVKEKASEDLAKAYEDGFNTVSNAFLDLPDVMFGLQDMLLGYTLSGTGQQNISYYYDAVYPYNANVYTFKNDATDSYNAARAAYDQNFIDYKATSRFSDTATMENLIDETYNTTKLISESIRDANNLVQLYKDTLTEQNKKPNSSTDSNLSQLSSYTGKANSYLSSLLSTKTTIQTDKETLIETNFDISDQQIKVTQAQDLLIDAQDNLNKCYVRAPLSGIITKIIPKKGDSVSASTVATIVPTGRIAELSLNEVDAAKIKVGQKATLTFDAIDGLTIAGQVAEVDTIGTVTQGVVVYDVQMSFDSEDSRVKPGMSVSASIITDMKQDVLTVPSSAVKVSGNSSYIEVFASSSIPVPDGQSFVSAVLPTRQTVQTGLSDDTNTEIISGLNEGDRIVVRTTTGSATASTQQTTASGLFGGSGNRTTGGGALRTLR